MEARIGAAGSRTEAEVSTIAVSSASGAGDRAGAEQTVGRAPHGPLLATLSKDATTIPISPGTLAPSDPSKAVASAAGPNAPAGQQSVLPPSGAAPQNTAPGPPQVTTRKPRSHMATSPG